MIQMRSILDVADNSGARKIAVINPSHTAPRANPARTSETKWAASATRENPIPTTITTANTTAARRHPRLSAGNRSSSSTP